MKESTNHLLEMGTVLADKWTILEFIGKGGMGEVYRAHQLNLNRDVAIKVISQEWLDSLDEADQTESVLERFRREIQTMAQVRHPNTLQIHDCGSCSVYKGDEEIFIEYIVLEYIPGATLRFTMSEDGLCPDEDAIAMWIRDVFLPLLDGVQAMHELGIIHRDLKPENVLMDGTIPKIADFGLARSTRFRPITGSLDIIGSPLYMSPEHFFEFRKADRRADIYSLGKMLCEAVAGKMSPGTVPFRTAKLAGASSPFLKKLDQIIQHATAEDRDKRLESAEKFRVALLDALASSTSKRGLDRSRSIRALSVFSRRKWAWAGVATIIISLSGLMAFRFSPLSLTRYTASNGQPVSISPGQTEPPSYELERLYNGVGGTVHRCL